MGHRRAPTAVPGLPHGLRTTGGAASHRSAPPARRRGASINHALDNLIRNTVPLRCVHCTWSGGSDAAAAAHANVCVARLVNNLRRGHQHGRRSYSAFPVGRLRNAVLEAGCRGIDPCSPAECFFERAMGRLLGDTTAAGDGELLRFLDEWLETIRPEPWYPVSKTFLRLAAASPLLFDRFFAEEHRPRPLAALFQFISHRASLQHTADTLLARINGIVAVPGCV